MAKNTGPTRRAALGLLGAAAAGGVLAAPAPAGANPVPRYDTTSSGDGLSKDARRRLREVLARHVESKQIPGLVALIGRGRETYVEALGTMRHEGGAPMRRDTIFRMASTSKPVVMSAALALLDDCRMRLSDPVEIWLPELANRVVLKKPDGPIGDTVPARRPITVRDILTSTFGLGLDATMAGTPIHAAVMAAIYPEGMNPVHAPDEWMRRLGTLPLATQPGESWAYNVSLDVLGVLVARVSGKSFEDFLRERIFEPLGMKDTGFHVPAAKIDRLPPSYAPNPQTGEFTIWDEAIGGKWSKPPAFQGGGGGLASTVDDYHAYFRMLLNKGVHGSKRILSKAAVELMTTDRLTAGQRAEWDRQADNPVAFGLSRQGAWGMGMAVRVHRDDYASIGQFGWDGGTGTTAYADPEKGFFGIMLTQVAMSVPNAPRAIHDFWTAAYQAIDE
ncbi:serine hydrolase [Actinorhabdospora filicis]|uniref:Serine hydrolase n=1 Tax=Actinorhabdospora filicis TaxID=1785913 RepID=A0A9W6W2X4_9ACTN|nr:serine hydrolase domain-containing protein [Actinorhabdospora filicis]GLZ77497.1 serine hydrolase [Actinorhabdospora filicis]